MSRLCSKTILITGASSGIGRSTALEFAQAASLKLILTARRLDRLQDLADEIIKEYPSVKVHIVQLDVSDADQVRGLVSSLPEEFRDVDILINNAYPSPPQIYRKDEKANGMDSGLVKGTAQAPHISETDISTMLSTNISGLINMTQAILPIMLHRNNGSGSGDVINIGSIAGREPYIGGSIYCATKAAVRSFTEALRKELISSRVRVMCVDPGQVETEFSVVRFGGDKKRADAVYKGCEPLTPEDVAEVIVFAAGRRENVVVADTLLFPSHQGGASLMHRNI